MFGSRRPDGAVARHRLRSITPGWTPSASDLSASDFSASDFSESDLSKADHQPAARHQVSARANVVAATAGDEPGTAPAERELPPPPRSIWRLDAAAVRGLASLGLAAAVGALVMVVVGWPRGTAMDAAKAEVAGSETVTNVLAEPSPSAGGAVIVDVDGRVRSAGVVELPIGARVIDAIEAAGGVSNGADTAALNLAQVLIDGEQVIVPRLGEAASSASGTLPEPAPGASAPAGTTSAAISINSASETELEVLPGIGPVLAAAIVEWRTQNGGFTSIEQLQDVSGIGPATFAELAPLVRL